MQIGEIEISLNLDLATFDECRVAGNAMYDAWEAQHSADPEGDIEKPPFERDDGAWGNLWMKGLLEAREFAFLKPGPNAWRKMEEAPYDKAVIVRVGYMTFQARLLRDNAMTSEDASCDQWVAEHEGEHPACWTDGACWDSNSDDQISMQPAAWRFIGADE